MQWRRIPGTCALALCLVACLTNQFQNDPARKFSSYRFDADSPLSERIAVAPQVVLDYLKRIDNVSYYAAYTPTDQDLSTAKEYLSRLPGGYQKLLSAHLLGIYFIQSFIGSGLTEYVYDEYGEPYAFIAVNSATLSTGMSDWITARDRSCFTIDDASGIRLSSDCGEGYTGLMYILLHETSHIVDFLTNFSPSADEGHQKRFPFISPYWNDFPTPKDQYDFPLRKQLAFYGLNGGPKISIHDAPEAYRQFSRTPFASLYGSQTVLEDYAELFTWTYYTQILHQQYIVTLSRNGEVLFSYEPLGNPAIIERSKALGDLLN